jgi:hypothetical protein
MNTKEACQLILKAMGDGGDSYSIWVSLLKLLIWLEIWSGWIYSDEEIEIQVVA